MTISVFNLFSIGIGPSSSHTVGPMKAAHAFMSRIQDQGRLTKTHRIEVELFGSLAFTGKGHGTDCAILMGLEGNLPESINPDIVHPHAKEIIESQKINLFHLHPISFNYRRDMIFNFKDLLPAHTNGMRFSIFDAAEQKIYSHIYYSIGGGFILDQDEADQAQTHINTDAPYPFETAKALLEQC